MNKPDLATTVARAARAPAPPKPTAPKRVMPDMLPRPEDMTRQTHRRLFREACKLAGVSYRDALRAQAEKEIEK